MYVDAAYCYRWSSEVCQSVMVVSCAKTAELIDMPYGLWIQVDPMNHIRWGSRSLDARGNFEGGKRRPVVKYRESLK